MSLPCHVNVQWFSHMINDGIILNINNSDTFSQAHDVRTRGTRNEIWGGKFVNYEDYN